tara:strand:+ start:18 stop:476 length:459 start_codon:yes stop_codon:yes gene_type:complete
MANYIIFDKDGYKTGLAKTESLRDHFLNHYDGSVSKEIAEDKWTSAAQNTITLILENDTIQEYSTETYDTNRDGESDEERNQRWQDTFRQEHEDQIRRVKDYLDGITDAEWEGYLNNLNSVDISTVTFPIDSFQKWFNSQSGYSQKSIWELP